MTAGYGVYLMAGYGVYNWRQGRCLHVNCKERHPERCSGLLHFERGAVDCCILRGTVAEKATEQRLLPCS